ncbi:ribonuclease toxin immunity protein CdiI [Pectobacterium versatile]
MKNTCSTNWRHCLKYIRLACERYVKIHPEDADKVKFLLDKISN